MSFDLLIKIRKNNEDILGFGGRYHYYDNYMWYDIDVLIKLGLNDQLNDTFFNLIKNYGLFKIDNLNDYEANVVIDFDNKTVSVSSLEIMKIEEVAEYGYDFELIKKDDKYYTVYSEEDIFELTHVSFDEELLTKGLLTFDEFYKVFEFIENCLSNEVDDNEFILNETKFLRLNIN